MKFEGVTFVPAAVKAMKKEAFIKAHKKVLWLDREEKERITMLSDAYDAIEKL